MTARELPRRFRRVAATRKLHRRTLRSLRRAPWGDPKAMDDLRTARLRRLLDHAASNVPFQAERLRAAGCSGAAIGRIEDLLDLPVVDKAQMRTAGTAALWSDPTVATVWKASSGTTGEPFRHAHDVTFDARIAAVRAWIYGEIGAPSGPVIESFGGSGVRRIRGSTSHAVHVVGYETPLDEQILALERVRPRVLYGNRSSLLRLADVAADRDDLRVPFVVSTAELLSPHDRSRLRCSFDARVHDVYGVGEVGVVCAQVDQTEDVATVVEPSIILEILVDGRPARPGEVGEAVVSSLDEVVMPFIRYATGDLLRLAPESAPSGRSGMRVEVVEGRAVDVPVDIHGRPVLWSDLGDQLWARPTVAETVRAYRIVQHDPGFVQVLVEPRGEQVPPGVAEEIRQAVAERLAGPEVRIDEVPDLTRSTRGKHRPFVSKIDPPAVPAPPDPRGEPA